MNISKFFACACVCAAFVGAVRAEIDASHTTIFLYNLAKNASLRVCFGVRCTAANGRSVDSNILVDLPVCGDDEQSVIEVDLSNAKKAQIARSFAFAETDDLKDLYITRIQASCIDCCGRQCPKTMTDFSTTDSGNQDFKRTDRLYFSLDKSGKVVVKLPVVAAALRRVAKGVQK